MIDISIQTGMLVATKEYGWVKVKRLCKRNKNFKAE